MNISLLEKKASDYTEIYSSYYALIYSVVLTRVNNHDETEDICQEVFIRLYEKFHEINNYRKWLYGTLRNTVLEHFRKKYHDEVSIEDVFKDISITFVNGFRDTRIIIEEALDSMDNFENDSERIIFDLIAIRNFTYNETARELGLTERQVRYRYGLITERIIKYLKGKGIKSLEELL
jgi:RNA polymerase sigma-70 factor, ECF subfamily